MRPREALTSWTPQSEGQVRTQKECDRARDTDFLETASGRTDQDTERIRSSVENTPTGVCIGRHKLEHGKKVTERGALTCW